MRAFSRFESRSDGRAIAAGSKSRRVSVGSALSSRAWALSGGTCPLPDGARLAGLTCEHAPARQRELADRQSAAAAELLLIDVEGLFGQSARHRVDGLARVGRADLGLHDTKAHQPAQRLPEGVPLGLRQGPYEPQRMDSGKEESLVAIDVSHARENALVEKSVANGPLRTLLERLPGPARIEVGAQRIRSQTFEDRDASELR